MKLTFKEILEKVEAHYGEVEEFAYDHESTEISGVGQMEEVDQYGGEGMGDDWYAIKHFPDHDVYVKVSGYYSSYDGTDFDGWNCCTEVKPAEKKITVYE